MTTNKTIDEPVIYKNQMKTAITDDEFMIADQIQLTKYVPQAMPLAKFMETFGE